MKKLLVTLIIIIVLTLVVYKAMNFIKIDKCLDLGGKWTYESGNCEEGGGIKF